MKPAEDASSRSDTVQPPYNEGSRDWQNLLAITKFRYYGGSFSYILLLLGLRRSFVIRGLRYIEVPLYLFFRYDPRELDVVLREVVIMNSRAEMYSKFIEKRISVRTFYVEYFFKKITIHPSPITPHAELRHFYHV